MNHHLIQGNVEVLKRAGKEDSSPAPLLLPSPLPGGVVYSPIRINLQKMEYGAGPIELYRFQQ